jgi:hypothetical protein
MHTAAQLLAAAPHLDLLRRPLFHLVDVLLQLHDPQVAPAAAEK